MPRISAFRGITIAMFWDETGHRLPHFHAEHAGRVASVSLDGQVLAGSLPARQLQLVREWAQLHREEIRANWERARRLEPLQPIDPLA